jgi:hypothetical protein
MSMFPGFRIINFYDSAWETLEQDIAPFLQVSGRYWVSKGFVFFAI